MEEISTAATAASAARWTRAQGVPGRAARWRRFAWAVPAYAAVFFAFGEAARLPVPSGDGPLAYAFGAAEVHAQLRVPSSAVFFVAALMLAFLHRGAALLTLCAAALLALPALTLRAGAVSPSGGAETSRLQVVHVNLLHPNLMHDAVLNALTASDPDVISVCEVSGVWREALLERLLPQYPHTAEGLDRDAWTPEAWGQMIFARFPLDDVRAEPLYEGERRQRPVLSARMRWGRRSVIVVAAHPQRPGRPWKFRARRAQLAATSAAARRPGGDASVVCADLNTTEGSPWFEGLLEEAGLVDSRRGHGWQPSWFLGLPGLPWRLRPGLPLDHVLTSPELQCVERGTFAVPGSDHRGVRATLQWVGPDAR